MIERPQRRVLWVTLLVAVILLLTLYIYGSTQSSAEFSSSTFGHDAQQSYLIGQIKGTSSPLNKIKSGKSSIFVDEYGRVAIPQADVVGKLDIVELEELFYRYMENIHTSCIRMFHMGNENDGGYHICETYLSHGPCLMYSFGNRRDYSFDDAVANTYGCEVHSFDPGDGQKDHKHSDKVTFHSIGIGGEDKNIKVGGKTWKIMSFGSIKNMLDHKNKKLDIVKIDTEAAEWDSLETMIKTGDIRDINLLIVEFHEWIAPGKNPGLADARKPEKFRRYLNILRGIHESGFRVYFFRMWPWCHYPDSNGIDRTACHEVHMVNINRNKFS